LAISGFADLQVLLVADRSGGVSAWDLTGPRKIWGKKVDSWFITWGAVGSKLLALYGVGRKLEVVHLATGEQVREPMTGHTDTIYSVGFIELDGRPVAISGARDMTVRLWDLETGTIADTIDVGASALNLAVGPMSTIVLGQITGVTALRLHGARETLASLPAELVRVPDDADDIADNTLMHVTERPGVHDDDHSLAGHLFSVLGAENRSLYEEAVAEYDEILEVNPTSLAARKARGRSLIELGRYEDAQVDLSTALESEPDDISLLTSHAIALYYSGHFRKALRELDRGLAITPGLRFALQWRAIVRKRLGLYELALEDFTSSLIADPEGLYSLCGKADTLARLGDVSEAEAAYQNVLRLHADSAIAHGRYAAFLSELGRYDSALAELLESPATGGTAEWLDWLLITLIRAGRYAEAVSYGEQVLAEKTPARSVYVNIGEALLLNGNIGKARQLLEKALAIRPTREPLVLSAAIDWHFGDHDRALARFRAACEVDDFCTPFRLAELQAIALTGLGESQTAVNSLTAAVPFRLPGDVLQVGLYELLAAPHPLPGWEELRLIVASTAVTAPSFRHIPDPPWLTETYLPVHRTLAIGEAIRLPHDDDVVALAFSPDGTKVATGSHDQKARVFDAASGIELHRVVHGHWVKAVAFSPDGAHVASGSLDGTIRVFDAMSGAVVWQADHGGGPEAVAFSPDGVFVAVCNSAYDGAGVYDRSARVYDAATGREISRVTPGEEPWCLAFSPDSAVLMVGVGQYFGHDGQRSGSVLALDPVTGDVIWRRDDVSRVKAVSFSPDGGLIAIGSSGPIGSAHILNAATGAIVHWLRHDETVMAVAFSPDGSRLATGSGDHTARVFDAETGAEICRLTHGDWVRVATFSPDGTLVATGSQDGTARIFDAATGREAGRLEHGDWVRAVAFSQDGTRVATASHDDYARIWRIRS